MAAELPVKEGTHMYCQNVLVCTLLHTGKHGNFLLCIANLAQQACVLLCRKAAL